jgi:hypothetical protein
MRFPEGEGQLRQPSEIMKCSPTKKLSLRELTPFLRKRLNHFRRNFVFEEGTISDSKNNRQKMSGYQHLKEKQ